MPRISRIVAPELPHHITQRGNNRRIIFYGREDLLRYLDWFQEYATKFGLTVLGYCLMSNHVHFIVVPTRPDSLASVFKSLNTRFSHYINKKTESSGHLWQGRFFSCIVQGPHLLRALKYVERNPVRAGMVSLPWEWEWSSAAEHSGESPSYFDRRYFDEMVAMTHVEWKSYIAASEEIDSVYEIRKSTHVGHPLVTAVCLEELNNKRGLCLTAQRPRAGRKRTNVNLGVCP
jgi:putative transposase